MEMLRHFTIGSRSISTHDCLYDCLYDGMMLVGM